MDTGTPTPAASTDGLSVDRPDRALGGRVLAAVPRRRARLVGIMAAVALLTAVGSIAVTYQLARNVRRDALVERAASRAALIRSLHEATGDRAAVLAILRDEHRESPGFGRTGELTIAELRNGEMVFLLRRGATGSAVPAPVPVESSLAQPMREALGGRTGWTVAPDYDGIPVLAAYQPVPELGWGLVAKMDLAEVRTPFLAAAGAISLLALALVVGGAWAFLRGSEPFVRQLAERERLLDAMLETIPVGVWIADAGGTIVRGNPAARDIWQGSRFVPPEDYGLYRGWWRSDGSEIAAEDWALARAVRRGETSLDEEIEIECFDGTRKVILNSAIPLRDEAGRVTGAVATNLDVTASVRAQDEVHRLNAELEQRVEERTAELAHANRELEAFAYSVSHDLRAPLRAMAGFAQALVEDYAAALDPSGRDLLGRIRAAAERMGRLIDDLLALSRVGRRELRREEVDLSALAEAVGADLAARHPERRVELAVTPGLRCTGDPELLRLVLENLLGNAWKFTSRRAVAHVEVTVEKGAEGETVLAVRDDGAGFDMAYADRLFAPFQRLHPVQEFEGTGVGLTTVQRIVRRHGGSVWAEAAPERGATFRLTLGDLRWTPRSASSSWRTTPTTSS